MGYISIFWVGLIITKQKIKNQNIYDYSNDRVDGVRPSMEFLMNFSK